jgi:threonine/homoserine/homoserine lactone efflux protein
MTYELILALVGFAFVTSITPGPNNLMLMASGANFGFRLTIPHMLGISLGHMLMIVLVGLGLNQIFVAYPPLHTAMKVASVGYLLYLAWKIASAAPPKDGESKGKPFTFLQAALFQWVNPKGWFMALTAISVYAPDQAFASILVVAAVFAAINLPSVSAWTVMGQQIRHILTSNARLRAYNWTMAALLVASLVLILK